MIRLIILCALFIVACSSKDKKPPSDKYEVETVVVDKNALAKPTSLGALPNLTGIWKSQSPEPAGNGTYVSREFNFTMSRWELTYAMSGDKEMKKPFFISKAEGSYVIENASTKKPGAFLAVFKNSRKYLQLQTKDKGVIKQHNLDTCKLEFGKEKDISTTGCADFKAIGECPQEFDLVKIENGNLLLGERPPDNDLCTEGNRPEGFGPALKKIN